MSSTTVNIHEAKTHLSRLIERTGEGETIIIAKAGKPKVMRIPVPSPAPRRPGRFAGKIVVCGESRKKRWLVLGPDGGSGLLAHRLREGGDERLARPIHCRRTHELSELYQAGGYLPLRFRVAPAGFTSRRTQQQLWS